MQRYWQAASARHQNKMLIVWCRVSAVGATSSWQLPLARLRSPGWFYQSEKLTLTPRWRK